MKDLRVSRSVIFSLMLLSFSILAAPSYAHPDREEPIVRECGVSGSYFQVWTASGKKEKYVGGQALDYSCGRDVAAAIFGSSFVFFNGEKFVEKYVTSVSSQSSRLQVNENLAVAVMGPYFVFASRASGLIQERHVTTPSDYGREVRLAVGTTLGVATMGSYLVTTDGKTVSEKYVGSSLSKDAFIAVGRHTAGVLAGSNFYAIKGTKVLEKYVGSSQPRLLVAKGDLVALIAGSTFFVYNGQKDVIRDTYVGSLRGEARLTIRGNVAVLSDDQSPHLKSYSVTQDRFE